MPQISSLITFYPATKAISSEINSNFEDLRLGHNDQETRILAEETKTINLNIINVLDYGVKFDGVSDDSAAFNAAQVAAYIAGAKIKMPAGTSLLNVTFNHKLHLEGSGVDKTILKPFDIAKPVIILPYNATTDSRWTRSTFSNFRITGNTATPVTNGIQFGHVPFETNDATAGGYLFSNLLIEGFDKGVAKLYGNIGNVYENCLFEYNNFGVWAKNNASPSMQNGSDKYIKTSFISNKLACIYANGMGGQHDFDNCHFEANLGFGLFIKDVTGYTSPIVIDNTWFEGNATAGSVTIDGVAYTPRDLYISGTNKVEMRSSGYNSIELANSSVLAMTNCSPKASTSYLIKDDASLCVCNGDLATDMTESTATLQTGVIVCKSGITRTKAFWKHARTNIAKNLNNNIAYSESFALANTYAFTSSSITGYAVQDGNIFDRCVEISIPAGASTHRITSGVIPANKYIVATADVKLISGDNTKMEIGFLSNGTVMQCFNKETFKPFWKTIVAMTDTTSKTAYIDDYFRIVNTGATTAVLRLSALQVVYFDTLAEAVAFEQSGAFAMRTGGSVGLKNLSHPLIEEFPREFRSNATPTTGTWARGDSFKYTAPSAAGFEGEVCTTSGTSGTLSGITGTITSAKSSLVLNSLTGIEVGQYISIVGVTGTKKILRTPLAIASTTVNANSSSGQKVLNVAATSDFNVNDYIVIGQGTVREENAIIASITAGVSMTITANLTYTHLLSDADTVKNACYIDSASNATVTGAAVAYVAPVWKTKGVISA